MTAVCRLSTGNWGHMAGGWLVVATWGRCARTLACLVASGWAGLCWIGTRWGQKVRKAPGPARRLELRRKMVLLDCVDALAVFTFRGIDFQAHFLTQLAADEPAH